MHTPAPFALDTQGLTRKQIATVLEMSRKWAEQDLRLEQEPRPVIKRCGKCQTTYTTESWPACRYRGVQPGGMGERYELRNCTCGSTMALLLPEV